VQFLTVGQGNRNATKHGKQRPAAVDAVDEAIWFVNGCFLFETVIKHQKADKRRALHVHITS